jgi:2-isopropylmalate synthase
MLMLRHLKEREAADRLEQAVAAVKHAKKYCSNVEFSAMDAGRSDLAYVAQMFEAVIDAGATTVNFPDTVGYTIPHEFGAKIKYLVDHIPNIHKAIISVHCHNDLGLAVANSLAAIVNGCRQAECTINGIGERAGNAALEEIVMAVRTRQDVFPCEIGLDTHEILNCSRLVANITGFQVQPNKAVVGANAFAHESGIHQDGVIKSRETYEIMRAQDVGWTNNRLVLGKHSGRNAFRTRLKELGYEFPGEEELNEAFKRFKELADKKHEIFDADLQALVTDAMQESYNERVKFLSLKAMIETGEIPMADITLAVDGEEQTGHAQGDGPVDAVFKAIESVVESGCKLQLYSVSNITGGTDSQGEVTVRVAKNGRIVNGRGSDTDIIAASAKAYISAINRAMQDTERAHPQV